MSGLLTPDPWVKLHPQARARVRLFCFPYGGGGSGAYIPWVNEISPDIEICAVQLPGRESRLRETPFTAIEPLIERLAEALKPYIDVPFAFYGHSLGALVSFELTRYMRRQQGPLPNRLFVSGCRAPQLPDPDPPIHQLPDGAFIEALRRFNGTPASVLQNAEIMQMLLPVLRADFAIYETYAYAAEEPLSIPISAYGGLQDFRASREAVEAWKLQTSEKCIIRMYPGDHFFIHTKRRILLSGIHQDMAFSPAFSW